MATSKKTAATPIKAEEYLKRPYARVLVPEPEGGYFGEVLEFPGCYSQGDTPEEAISNLDEAATNWIEAALAQGQRIPEPSDAGDASGKVALRLPRTLHRKAIQMAERERVSLNTFLIDAIAARVGAQDLLGRFTGTLDNRLRRLEENVKTATGASVWRRPISSESDMQLGDTSGKSTFVVRQYFEVGGING